MTAPNTNTNRDAGTAATDAPEAGPEPISARAGALTTLSGGALIARMLQLHGVGPIFGMGGFQLLPLYDEARQLGLRHYLINDERTGAFAADAYARVTGRPGVCDATLGPGATNLVTALVESTNAGIPVIAIVGDAHRDFAGRNMTQEARQSDILRPAVKQLIRVESVGRIPELVRRAFSVATAGRAGAVVLAVPEDIAHQIVPIADADLWADATKRGPRVRSRPTVEAITGAADLLAGSRRPLMLIGGGAHLSGAYAEIQALAEHQHIPVGYTLSGKGSVDDQADYCVGLFGRYSRTANDLIAHADCLLVVGCKLGEIATKRYALPDAGVPIIQIDAVAEELGRWRKIHVPIWADAREALRDLMAALTDRPGLERRDYLDEIAARKQTWLTTARPKYRSADRPITMARLISELNTRVPAQGILVADGGFAAHWAGLLYDAPGGRRSFVADRGFASIGYGLPGAIGAALAAPHRPIVALSGDGGTNMTLGDLETAARLQLNLTLVVVNNAASGYVKALQHAVYGPGNYQSSDLREGNYAKLAEALGCNGIRVEDPDDLPAALDSGMHSTGRPTVIDVIVTRDPAHMLPGVDSRALRVDAGDRPV